MHRFKSIRSAALAISLTATLGTVGTAFADTLPTQHDQQEMQQPSQASPYDSSDFTLDDSNIHN